MCTSQNEYYVDNKKKNSEQNFNFNSISGLVHETKTNDLKMKKLKKDYIRDIANALKNNKNKERRSEAEILVK